MSFRERRVEALLRARRIVSVCYPASFAGLAEEHHYRRVLKRSVTFSAFRVEEKNAWTLADLVASSEEGESARAGFDAFLQRLGNRVAFRG